MKKIMAVFLLITFTGCASKSNNINATYVSPLQYQSYNCSQIGQEVGRVKRKVDEISGEQDRSATKDTVALTVGLVIFGPALFFMIGGDKKEELSRLKGEYEALEKIAIEKDCATLRTDNKKIMQHQGVPEKQNKELEKDESKVKNIDSI